MKTTRNVSVQKLASAALALLALVVAAAPGARARPRPAKQQPGIVLAHLALSDAPVRQMFVEERGGKQYLYIEQDSKEGFAIIDVTKPAQPKVIQHVAWPNQASAGKLQMIGAGLALAIAPEADPGKPSSDYPAQSVRVLDLSDPGNPQTLHSFSGVTSVVADDGRDLIYVANSEGLWILRHRQEQAAPKEWEDTIYNRY
ncbi:MAG TPA: hypothetical protein VHM88_07615 [Candidatus Acidoferrales bacterium]|jgi:hypothetical protein|nr:hypothetical protein [Candidatus Acidoferrales bacterium]